VDDGNVPDNVPPEKAFHVCPSSADTSHDTDETAPSAANNPALAVKETVLPVTALTDDGDWAMDGTFPGHVTVKDAGALVVVPTQLVKLTRIKPDCDAVKVKLVPPPTLSGSPVDVPLAAEYVAPPSLEKDPATAVTDWLSHGPPDLVDPPPPHGLLVLLELVACAAHSVTGWPVVPTLPAGSKMHGNRLVQSDAEPDLTVPPQLVKTARYKSPLSDAEVVKLSHAVPDANDEPVLNVLQALLENTSQ
jgi:hypothetical protein